VHARAKSDARRYALVRVRGGSVHLGSRAAKALPIVYLSIPTSWLFREIESDKRRDTVPAFYGETRASGI